MKRLVGAALCGMLWLAGLGAARAEPLPVVASFSILADLVREVGGEHVAVTALVGPDQDAHVFQPTPSHVASVARARLVVINGLGFEGWLARLVQSAGYTGPVSAATDGIGVRTREHGGRQVPDPHAWHDPTNVMQYARNIAGALATVDPAHADAYARNADAYAQKLETLDAWIDSVLASVPSEHRKVITSHDAMAYFGRRYGVEFIAAQGASTASEPSARQVARLVGQVRAEGVTALFVENMASDAVLRQIAAETGATIGGRLYTDALSAPSGDAADYLALMRHNAGQLAGVMQR